MMEDPTEIYENWCKNVWKSLNEPLKLEIPSAKNADKETMQKIKQKIKYERSIALLKKERAKKYEDMFYAIDKYDQHNKHKKEYKSFKESVVDDKNVSEQDKTLFEKLKHKLEVGTGEEEEKKTPEQLEMERKRAEEFENNRNNLMQKIKGSIEKYDIRSRAKSSDYKGFTKESESDKQDYELSKILLLRKLNGE